MEQTMTRWVVIVVALLVAAAMGSPSAQAAAAEPTRTSATPAPTAGTAATTDLGPAATTDLGPAATTGRVGGSDRYATSAAISRRAFPGGSEAVYLARGDEFADAVAGGMLTDGPILLVRPCGTVPAAVQAEITRLAPRQVVALGGPGAVCEDTLRAAAAGRATDRIAGDNRYDTAALISERVYRGQTEGPVYVANGTAYADAVAAGSLTDGPVLLVRPDGSYPTAVLWELARLASPQAVGIGGPTVVADSTLQELPYSYHRPDRVHGSNRYDTAASLAGRAFPEAPSTVYLARGDTLADAVAAGVLADGPVLLVTQRCGALPASVTAYLSLVTPDRVLALGGPGAVCDATLQAASAAARPGQLLPTASVAADAGHSCAVTAAGAVRCWGYNGAGQLGDGTTTASPSPVSVKGLGAGTTRSVAVGGGFTCALTTDGAVRCWGSNHDGTLAGPYGTHSTEVVDIPRLGAGTTVQVTTGQKHACALSITGATRCWGSNSSSQLGIGMEKGGSQAWPALVSGLGPGTTRQVDATYLSTCAVRTDGAALCWGSNVVGGLGDGTDVERTTPSQVSGLGPGTTAQVSAGVHHGCAVTREGAVRCWGDNAEGGLGYPHPGGGGYWSLVPVEVGGLGPGSATAVDASGSGFNCALTTAAATVCWGANTFGTLGVGAASEPRATPGPVQGLGGGTTAQVAAGYRHVCALTTGGEVRCWGDNWYGQIGDGTDVQRDAPVRVTV
ncbi:cell wall-binding repeat-containing protein [Ornithinimicrobium pekingense]|nr:cell wall-binding repeat-containing protein [Ornithinimicrobium pekingense]